MSAKAPMHEHRFHVGETKHGEYLYLLPIMGELFIDTPFWSLPPEARQGRYTDAVIGIKTVRYHLPTKRQADVLVRTREEKTAFERHGWYVSHLQVWMLANAYTIAKSSRMVASVRIQWHAGMADIHKITRRIVEQVL